MGAIIGGAVGGFVLLVLLLVCGVLYYRHTHTDTQITTSPYGFTPVVPVPGASNAEGSGNFSEFNPSYVSNMYGLENDSRRPEPSTAIL